MNRLIEQYHKFYGLDSGRSNMAQGSSSSIIGDDLDYEDFDTSLNQYLEGQNNSVYSSDMERYLSDVIEPKISRFEILDWWKRNSFRYLILAEIIRDILIIPISTVASESVFSTDGCVIDPYRSFLALETVQTLICRQNWLTCEPFRSWEMEEHVEDVNIEGKGGGFGSSNTGKGKSKTSKHITHGFQMVKGKSSHPMEDYVVSEFKQVKGEKLGLFAIFDGHSGHDVAS